MLPRPAFPTAGNLPHATRRREEARGVRGVLRKDNGRPEAQAPGALGGRTPEVTHPGEGGTAGNSFRREIADSAIGVLRAGLEGVRGPDEPPLEPWSTGTSVAYMQ